MERFRMFIHVVLNSAGEVAQTELSYWRIEPVSYLPHAKLLYRIKATLKEFRG